MFNELISIMNIFYNGNTRTYKEIDVYTLNNHNGRVQNNLNFSDERFSLLMEILMKNDIVEINSITEYRPNPTYSLTTKGIFAKENNSLQLLP